MQNMQIHWESIDEQLKSSKVRDDEFVRADFAARERVRRALRQETADIAAALVALGQRLAAAGLQVVARAIMPDYWVKVGGHSVGIQVSLAGPSWLVMNDGRQTDEIVPVVDGDRSYWALATEPAREVDLTTYFGKQFTAFVARVQEEKGRQRGET
jgi:hypothetical protein